MYAPALLVRGRRAEPLVNCYILFIGKQNKYLLINKYIKNTPARVLKYFSLG